MKFLIWGSSGWIGSQIISLLKDHEVIAATSRLEDYPGIVAELDEIEPDFVIDCAGIVGTPNIDWCEDHIQETLFTNIVGTINLIHACWLKGIHVSYYGSGCIYSGNGFSENDDPNFAESVYSMSKVCAEIVLNNYDNVLILRLRMPVGSDLHPKSLLAKLISFSKVINIANSITILPEILPITISMTLDRLKGVYNCVNTNSITHPQVLDLYKKYINPDHTYEIFTVEEQNEILKTARSNCCLDNSKLRSYHPVRDAGEAIETVIKNLI